MTGDAVPPGEFRPASMPPASLARGRAVWYRRPWVLVVAAIVVVVAASILVDLPRPVSTADDAASQTASLKEINQDVASCGYAVSETFTIYQDQQTGALTPSDQALVPTLLRDDQTACSFTSSAVFDLTNNIQVQNTAAGQYIDRTLSVVTTWVTSDALSAVEDIQALSKHQNDQSARRDLSHQEVLLAQDRASALADVQKAAQILGRPLPAPDLPGLPHLIGT